MVTVDTKEVMVEVIREGMEATREVEEVIKVETVDTKEAEVVEDIKVAEEVVTTMITGGRMSGGEIDLNKPVTKAISLRVMSRVTSQVEPLKKELRLATEEVAGEIKDMIMTRGPRTRVEGEDTAVEDMASHNREEATASNSVATVEDGDSIR